MYIAWHTNSSTGKIAGLIYIRPAAARKFVEDGVTTLEGKALLPKIKYDDLILICLWKWF